MSFNKVMYNFFVLFPSSRKLGGYTPAISANPIIDATGSTIVTQKSTWFFSS